MTKFKKGKIVDKDGNEVKANYTGRKFELVKKKELPISKFERVGRLLISIIPIICTLGMILKNKVFWKFITEEKFKVLFGKPIIEIKKTINGNGQLQYIPPQSLSSVLENPSWDTYSHLTESDKFLIAVRFFKSFPSEGKKMSINKVLESFRKQFEIETNWSAVKPFIKEAIELSNKMQKIWIFPFFTTNADQVRTKEGKTVFKKIQLITELQNAEGDWLAKLNALDVETLNELKCEAIEAAGYKGWDNENARRSITTKMVQNYSYKDILDRALECRIHRLSGGYESCENIDNKVSDNFYTLLSSDPKLKYFFDNPTWETYTQLNQDLRYLIAGRHYYYRDQGFKFNLTSKWSYMQKFEREFKNPGADLGRYCLRAIKETLQISEAMRLFAAIKNAGRDKIAKLNDLNENALEGIKDSFLGCCMPHMSKHLANKMLRENMSQDVVKRGCENLIFHYKMKLNDNEEFLSFCTANEA